MTLNRTDWNTSDQQAFLNYLEQYRQPSKMDWAKRILNSNMDVLAMSTKTMDDIVKQIRQGNVLAYLDLKIFDHYEAVAIYGKLVCSLKDFDQMVHYLTIYLDQMENWAHVDLLSFDIKPENQDHFLKLSEQYLLDHRLFVRRLSLMILFQMVKHIQILPIIFKHIETLKDEDAYYVIMMAGWLLSECIILYPKMTLDFISTTVLNRKIVNKGIQKCRESRRLSQAEKDALLIYKK